jgi:hypothetical protein
MAREQGNFLIEEALAMMTEYATKARLRSKQSPRPCSMVRSAVTVTESIGPLTPNGSAQLSRRHADAL